MLHVFLHKGLKKEMMEKSQKRKYNACIQFGYYFEEMPGLDVPSAPDKEFYVHLMNEVQFIMTGNTLQKKYIRISTERLNLSKSERS